MRKFLIGALLITCVGFSVNVSSQVRVSLRDRAALIQAQSSSNLQVNKIAGKKLVGIVDNRVKVLLTVDDEASIDLLQSHGLMIEGRIGNHIYATAPVDKVDEIAATDGVKAFSLSHTLKLLNDKARVSGGVAGVQAGTDLPQAYSGSGVIVGIVDGGLDPSHITFNDANGKTRVRRLWDISSDVPVTYTDSNIDSFTTDDDEESHGTHVLGTIAGSCSTTDSGNDYHGVAPESDIAIACGSMSDTEILLGVKNIIDYANSEGKRVAINMSLGDNFGPHDGSDTFTAALNELATDTPIFLASGNEAADGAAIVKEFDNSSSMVKTVLTPGHYASEYYDFGASENTQGVGAIDIWSDDNTPVSVYLDVISTSNPSTPLYTLTISTTPKFVGNGNAYRYFVGTIPTSGTTFDSYYSNAFMGGYSEVNTANNRYHAELYAFLEPKNANSNTYVSLRVEGEPGHKVYIYNEVAGLAFSKLNSDFTAGDSDGSISNMACGKNTIVVGSYVSRSYAGSTVGSVSYFSSWGVLVDGRVLPDFVAPGSMIYSALSGKLSDDASLYYPLNDATTVSGKQYGWTRMQGTSMATPYATGVGALLLQANPDLTVEEIRSILRQTATSTGDYNGGAGRINAHEALKLAVSTLSSIDQVTVTPRVGAYIEPMGGNCWSVVAPAEGSICATVYNVAGVALKTFTGDSDQLTVDLNEFERGVYIIAARAARSDARLKAVVR